MVTNADQPASWTDLASRVGASPATHKSSAYTAWLSRMIAVEVLWWKSRRESATFACCRATLTRAFSLFAEPSCLRDRAFCKRRSFRSARRRNFGLVIFRPFDSTANDVRPRSIPTSASAAGNRAASAAGPGSTTKLAKYRPAASLITVTLAGSQGRGRDQRTGTSPIFGRRSFPPGVILNLALAVNRTAWRRSLRDLNRGGSIFGPFRSPLREAKKFRYAAFRSARDCWSTTADTSPSHTRSGVALAAASWADNSASVGYGSPAA